MIVKNRLNFTFRVVKNGRMVERCQTHSKRRFYNKIRTINWQSSPSKGYLRISYGKALTNFGKMENFYNDGWYDNKKDFMFALDAFATESLPEVSEGRGG